MREVVPPIRHSVTSLKFDFYTTPEIRSLSSIELISPHAYDNLGNPLPKGCYDPRMGPVSKDDGACVTCGKNYEVSHPSDPSKGTKGREGGGV